MKLFAFLKAHGPQFALYMVSGGSALLVDFGSYLLLTHLGVWYVAANIIGGILGFISAFITHKLFVFQKKGDTLKQLLKYGLTDLIGTLASTGILYALVETGLLGENIGKLVSMGIVIFGKFFILKFFVYA